MQGIHTDGRCPQKTMMREVRIYQKLIDLPFSDDFKFTDNQKRIWTSMTHRDGSNDQLSPMSDRQLDEWYLCSQLYRHSHGHEISSAKLLNEQKGSKRTDQKHPFYDHPTLLKLLTDQLCGQAAHVRHPYLLLRVFLCTFKSLLDLNLLSKLLEARCIVTGKIKTLFVAGGLTCMMMMKSLRPTCGLVL